MKSAVKARKIFRLRRRIYFSLFENFGDEFAWQVAKHFAQSYYHV